MRGIIAKRIWEAAAEPVRREGAKKRSGEPGAALRFVGCVEALRALRLILIELVTREESGLLSEIATEFCAMEREAAACANPIGGRGHVA
jgi:hypothetical protein